MTRGLNPAPRELHAGRPARRADAVAFPRSRTAYRFPLSQQAASAAFTARGEPTSPPRKLIMPFGVGPRRVPAYDVPPATCAMPSEARSNFSPGRYFTYRPAIPTALRMMLLLRPRPCATVAHRL